MLNLTAIKNDRERLVAELVAAGARFKGKACTCPFHDDKHPSAGVFLSDSGWRFKCQSSGCEFQGDVFDVMAKASGKTLEDVLREVNAAHAPVKQIPPQRVYESVEEMRKSVAGCTDVYQYTNPDTKVVELVVLRIQTESGKRFLQASPNGEGFVMTAPPGPLPIYNRLRIRGVDEVVMVEGEKCVHALTGVGIVATTTPGGAGNAAKVDLSPLAGKHVYLWPDADPPNPMTTNGGKAHPKPGMRTGIEHMKDVAARLEALTPPAICHWIDCDSLGLPDKGDAADFIDAMQESSVEDQAAAVRAVMATASVAGPASELAEWFRAVSAGELEVIDWPWSMVTRGTQALIPGSVTIVAGDPGSTKSFWVLQAAAYWHDNGVPLALFQVEKDRRYHLTRALAQRVGCSSLTDMVWIRENPEKASHYERQNQQWSDSFGACMYDHKTQSLKLADMADWVDRMGAAGKRIIIVDPISLCHAGKDRHLADEDFMSKVEKSVTRHGASLILVTHPVKGAKGAPSLGNTSGGAVYERASDTVVWVSKHDEPKQVQVRGGGAMEAYRLAHDVTCNRTIKLLKTRNGRGNGWNLAFQFSGETLTFDELGGITKETRQPNIESEVA